MFEPKKQHPNEVLLNQGGSEGKVKLINKTKHPVIVFNGDGEKIVEIEGEEGSRVPRVAEETERLKDFDFKTDKGDIIPFKVKRMKETENLPDPRRATLLIVSSVVAAYNPEREDLLVPQDFVTDEKGRIQGCKALAKPAFNF